MFIRLALIILALLAAERWIPGIDVESFYTALIVAIPIGREVFFLKVLIRSSSGFRSDFGGMPKMQVILTSP